MSYYGGSHYARGPQHQSQGWQPHPHEQHGHGNCTYSPFNRPPISPPKTKQRNDVSLQAVVKTIILRSGERPFVCYLFMRLGIFNFAVRLKNPATPLIDPG